MANTYLSCQFSEILQIWEWSDIAFICEYLLGWYDNLRPHSFTLRIQFISD